MKQSLIIFCLALLSTGCGKDPNAPADKTTSGRNIEGDIKFDRERAKGDFTLGGFDLQKQAERIKSLRALSDAELLDSIVPQKFINGETIAEMTRRGSAPLLAELQRRYEVCRNERIRETTATPNLIYAAENDELRLLSALHHMKGLPDPVPVIIKGDKKREVIFPDMPALEVVVVNKHPEQRQVAWTEGGNQRHGRRESFGFDVHRDDGKLMPVARPWFGFMGGIIHDVVLKSGEGWTREIYLGSYAELLPPGRYRVRAAYAFGRDIGMVPDKSATFMCFSEPIELVVAPHAIRLTLQERALAEQLSRSLPADQPVRMIEWGHEKDAPSGFIPSDSSPGRVLKLGWKAVPALIAAIEDKHFSPTQRAWAFALLYMITGRNFPLGDTDDEAMSAAFHGRLGRYDVIPSRRWRVIETNKDGKEREVLPAKIDAASQTKLAQRWVAWKKYIDVLVTSE